MNPTEPAAVSRLCPACGMCCNGVIFADVRLQPGRKLKKLKALGLVLQRKGKQVRLPQPCSCFDGRLCRIYEDRPSRCRAFECRLLQRVQAGEVAAAAALKAIRQIRRHVDAVRRLVRELGDWDEHLPLSRRCARVLAEPLDLAADPRVIKLRSRLMRAVDRLTEVLKRDFL